jgi:hypothetical protein
VPPHTVQRGRRSRRSRGQFVTGPRHILSVPGQDYVQLASTNRGRSQQRPQQSQTPDIPDPEQAPDVVDDPVPTSDFNFMTDVFITDPPETAELRQEKLRHKKKRQWARWTQEVIPSLLRPHLRLLHKSKSLCVVPRTSNYQCTCGGLSSRSLTIACVFFERAYNISSPSLC